MGIVLPDQRRSAAGGDVRGRPRDVHAPWDAAQTPRGLGDARGRLIDQDEGRSRDVGAGY